MNPFPNNCEETYFGIHVENKVFNYENRRKLSWRIQLALTKNLSNYYCSYRQSNRYKSLSMFTKIHVPFMRIYYHDYKLITYPFTIENNRTIAVRTHLEQNLYSISCAASIAQWLSLLPDDGISRRRLFNVANRGWDFQPRRCRFKIFSFFNPPFFKRFFYLLTLSF